MLLQVRGVDQQDGAVAGILLHAVPADHVHRRPVGMEPQLGRRVDHGTVRLAVGAAPQPVLLLQRRIDHQVGAQLDLPEAGGQLHEPIFGHRLQPCQAVLPQGGAHFCRAQTLQPDLLAHALRSLTPCPPLRDRRGGTLAQGLAQ
jgi:hypothetical protein